MPQRKTAIKDLRKTHKRQMHNLDVKTDIKKTVKKFLSEIKKKSKTEALATLKIVHKKFDKAAKDNVVHKNTASRRKSKFSRILTTLS